ncbi:MAG: CPBP family intramembrane metalloprotease [Anaerolineales bacterium]|nr:CPBP family intramembrane metalloprotease [Chloroflexota bacterium]MBL6982035.1 CPBP family intramembrane metalloprotease [Anaerolineales bacterium]
MKIIKNIFCNKEQARLRAGFRILIQLTVFFFLMKGLAALLGVPSDIASNLPLYVFLAVAGVRLFRVLISVWLSGRFLDRRPFADFGLRLDKCWWQDLVFGLGLGILLIGSVFLIELAAGWLTISDTFHTANSEGSFILKLIVFVILFICVGFSEELMYRGYHLTNIAEGFDIKAIGPKYSLVIAVFLSSILFGIFHLGSPGATPISTFNIFLWGALFGIGYVLTGRLAMPIGLHIAWNLFQGNVFGFPVSGTTFSSETVTFFSIQQSGPELWTGGAFGPEGGLLGLLVIIAGIFLIVGWVRIRYGSIKLHLQLAEPPAKE